MLDYVLQENHIIHQKDVRVRRHRKRNQPKQPQLQPPTRDLNTGKMVVQIYVVYMWILGVVRIIENPYRRGTMMNTTGHARSLPTVVVMGMRIDLTLRASVRGSVVSSKVKVITSFHRLTHEVLGDIFRYLKFVCRYECLVGGVDENSFTVTALSDFAGLHFDPDCTDYPFLSNCELIVKEGYCSNSYYRRMCCRTCALARQQSAFIAREEGFGQGREHFNMDLRAHPSYLP